MMFSARKMHCNARMVKHWHRFPREVVESPSCDILTLDTLLSNQFQAALHFWIRQSPEAPSDLNHSVIQLEFIGITDYFCMCAVTSALLLA